MRLPSLPENGSEDLQDVLTQLTREDGVFPEDAVRRAVFHREAIIPELLKILAGVRKNAKKLSEREGYMAHLYAMFLLAFFREKRAYSVIADLVTTLSKDILYDLMGDVVTEDLGRILASVSCGDPGLMKKMIENRRLDEYVRCAAMTGLVTLVAAEDLSREVVLDYFKSLFRGKLERKTSCVWGSLVCDCLDLYPAEVFEEIRRAFSEGWVEPSYVTLREAEAVLQAGFEKTMAELGTSRTHRLVQDPVKEMKWWACFHEGKEENDERYRMPDNLKIDPELLPQPVRREGPKTGRNESCPCGSGRKYKKCCLDGTENP